MQRRVERWMAGAGLSLCALLAGCSRDGADARFVREVPWMERGVWLKADTHLHTRMSDGSFALDQIAAASVQQGCDVLAATDHADRDARAATPAAQETVELVRRRFPGKIVLHGLEWNVPPFKGKEHANVLVPPGPAELTTLAEFKEKFDDSGRKEGTAPSAIEALRWLAETQSGPEGPLVFYNHPAREGRRSADLIDSLRQWCTEGGGVFVGLEGAPGHQRANPLGSYKGGAPLIDRWDPAVAEVGGVWDRLLGEGFDLWGALAVSDFHNDRADNLHDPWPGEFAETWIYAPDRTADGVMQALRAGTFFGVHGKIARKVRLAVMSPGLTRPAEAGEVVEAPVGAALAVEVRFTAPQSDWKGDPSRIDLIELIAVAGPQAKIIAEHRPTEAQPGLDAIVRLPPGGIVLRARGRRKVTGGPALCFYTNPIRITAGSGRVADPLAWVGSVREWGDLHRGDIGTVRKLLGASILFVAVLAAISWLTSLGSPKPGPRRSPAPWQEYAERPATAPPGRPWPRRKHFWLAAAAFALFVVYGSLVPFRYTPIPFADAVERFRNIPTLQLGIGSRADWVSNILLFVPVAFLLCGALLVDRKGWLAKMLAIPLVALVTIALGLAVEFVQIWFPPRTVSFNDVVAQTAGSILGAAAWFFAGQTVVDWLREYSSSRRRSSQIDWLLQAYFVGLVVYSLLPLDVTINPSELAQKYREGKIEWVPFRHEWAGGLKSVYDVGVDVLLFVPVGMMLSTIFVGRGRRVRPLWATILLGFVVASAMEACQLFVYSRFTNSSDVVVETAGVVFGWLAMRRFRGADAEGAFAAGRAGTQIAGARAWVWLALACGYVLFLCAVFWAPYDFVADPRVLRDRWKDLFEIPFKNLYRGSEFKAATELLRKLLFFAPLGVLLAMAKARIEGPIRRVADASTLLFVVGAATIVEMGQLLMQSHAPDVTDILLGTVGAVLGMAVAGRLVQSEGSRPVASPPPVVGPPKVIYVPPSRPEDVVPMEELERRRREDFEF